MDLLIKNVQIIDSSHNFYGDVYIENGKIKDIGRALGTIDKIRNNFGKGVEIIDGKGMVLMPAFVDTHAHFRDPGFTYKEDIETGSKAAVRGGYTTVTLMGNTYPTASSKEIIDSIRKKGEEVGLVDVYQCPTITENLDGKTLSHLKEFEGLDYIKAITDDGKGVDNSKVIYEAMEIAKKNNWIIMSHAEDKNFSKVDMRLAENVMTWRDIELAKHTGARLHMAHVSTREAMKYIIEGKNDGANITCEVTPHHIFLDDTISNYRVNPPIRKKEDVDFLIKAINLGYVDCIGTDHAPHSDEDKKNGAPGMIGIELAFSICYTKLVKERGISLSKLSSLMSGKPAEILGLNKGQIQPGYDGDVVLLDLNKHFIVDRRNLKSKSKNTPFEGKELSGDVVLTVKQGKVVYKGEF
ncbi:dihydroorotase [Clostridium massiliamazoniense]|uniref:dihydroorotase n=1 Tax=Clostridium massiliamazoniense TaxID=1347366 RepID=UPI0006D7923F|nr:dihydroorotase [Clostridium massiliamazoniense]